MYNRYRTGFKSPNDVLGVLLQHVLLDTMNSSSDGGWSDNDIASDKGESCDSYHPIGSDQTDAELALQSVQQIARALARTMLTRRLYRPQGGSDIESSDEEGNWSPMIMAKGPDQKQLSSDSELVPKADSADGGNSSEGGGWTEVEDEPDVLQY